MMIVTIGDHPWFSNYLVAISHDSVGMRTNNVSVLIVPKWVIWIRIQVIMTCIHLVLVQLSWRWYISAHSEKSIGALHCLSDVSTMLHWSISSVYLIDDSHFSSFQGRPLSTSSFGVACCKFIYFQSFLLDTKLLVSIWNRVKTHERLKRMLILIRWYKMFFLF